MVSWIYMVKLSLCAVNLHKRPPLNIDQFGYLSKPLPDEIYPYVAPAQETTSEERPIWLFK